jgi:hypothetical protein
MKEIQLIIKMQHLVQIPKTNPEAFIAESVSPTHTQHFQQISKYFTSQTPLLQQRRSNWNNMQTY